MNKLIVTFVVLLGTAAGLALGADAQAGGVIFAKTCKPCHGEAGAAPNDALAKMMGVTIPTLASADFQATKTDSDIKNAIMNGKGKMPAQKSVPAASVDDVVAYVRSLVKK
jgi:mono/diheme cytochrome c family protein